MSDPQAQLQEVEDLEASVDALMEDIEASSERVGRQVREVEAGEPSVVPAVTAEAAAAADDLEFADFETAHAALGTEQAGTSAAEPAAAAGGNGELDASKAALEALLGGVEEETEAVATEGTSEAAPTVEPGPAAIEEIDSAFASVEAVQAQAAAAVATGAEDSDKRAELESRANQPPIGDIEELDKALAQSAEAVMADAQRTPRVEPTAPPPPPEPEPVVRAPEPVPTPAATVVAVATPASAPVEAAPEPKPLLARALAPIGRVTTAALMPLNSVHARLPESTRQTVAYIAIMNVFFASVVWFMALRPRPEAEVSYDVKAIYLTEQAAREAEREAKAKADAEAKKGGHGEAKKDDGHGGGGHGEAKKPAKKDAGGHGEAKKPDKKAAAKKDAGHGGGH